MEPESDLDGALGKSSNGKTAAFEAVNESSILSFPSIGV